MFSTTETSYDSSDETQFVATWFFSDIEKAQKHMCSRIADRFGLEFFDSNEDVDYPWQIQFARLVKKEQYFEAFQVWEKWRNRAGYSVYDDGSFEIQVEEVALNEPEEIPELKIG